MVVGYQPRDRYALHFPDLGGALEEPGDGFPPARWADFDRGFFPPGGPHCYWHVLLWFLGHGVTSHLTRNNHSRGPVLEAG